MFAPVKSAIVTRTCSRREPREEAPFTSRAHGVGLRRRDAHRRRVVESGGVDALHASAKGARRVAGGEEGGSRAEGEDLAHGKGGGGGGVNDDLGGVAVVQPNRSTSRPIGRGGGGTSEEGPGARERSHTPGAALSWK